MGVGDLAGAHRSASRALWLCRGQPFSELDDVVDIHAEVRRLAILERSLREVRVEALIGLGRCDEVLSLAEELTETEPYSERGWFLAALALAGAHRRRDALLVASRARSVLAGAGMVPGSQLSDLEQRLVDGVDVTPLLRTEPRGAHGVSSPARAAPFVGRDEELANRATSWAPVGVSTSSWHRASTPFRRTTSGRLPRPATR